MNYRRWIGAGCLLLLLLLLGALVHCLTPYTKKWAVKPGEKPVTNPLKGWACWGENFSEGAGLSLAYVPIYWKDVEPEKGVYDFEGLEKQFHFSDWKRQGTRLIFRIVLDSPSKEKEMEIPQWLYEAMDGDGTWYDNDYGKGFSPNYENPKLQNAHRDLLCALGERYDSDPQVAYIQLGSLGHWGEWHVDYSAGIPRFPDSRVTDRYVKDYLEAFPSKKLLMRRPYGIVGEEGLGLYNDMFGEEEEHQEWMGWIRDGYLSEQNGQELPGAGEFWLKAPSAGEVAGSHPISWYFEENFEDTLEFIEESHTTYLGPHIPKKKELSDQGWANAEKCQQEMGYCFTVGNVSFSQQKGKDKKISIEWKNLGVAPFYEDWKVRVVLKDEDGLTLLSQDFPAEMSSWGETFTFTETLSGSAALPMRGIQVWVGIVDPMTGTCTVKLAVDCEEEKGLYCLGKV